MRLIDADKLKKHIRRCDDSATRATFDYVYEDDIDDMPTVDVLEQIRAEIQENINYNKKMNYQGIVTGLLLTLKIIDKYKGYKESSDADREG